MDEVKDAMPARVHACDQVRPCHRTLRRNAGGKQPERSLLNQGGEVRHFALGHECLQQLRIHAVDPENDELLIAPELPGLAGNEQCGRGAKQHGEPQVPDW